MAFRDKFPLMICGIFASIEPKSWPLSINTLYQAILESILSKTRIWAFSPRIKYGATQRAMITSARVIYIFSLFHSPVNLACPIITSIPFLIIYNLSLNAVDNSPSLTADFFAYHRNSARDLIRIPRLFVRIPQDLALISRLSPLVRVIQATKKPPSLLKRRKHSTKSSFLF